ncbi:MAG: ComEC/Rec2 family competence protein [Anaerolineales bacterium]|jgi:competence protein ComEC
MPVNTNGQMWIYCLNVGQGDTTVVITPGNRVMIFDATRGSKILRLLDDLGLTSTDSLQHMVISHPHHDHYSGAEPLLNAFQTVRGLTLSSMRRVTDTTPSYNNIINTAVSKDVPLTFLSGYTQLYPDANPVADPDTLVVELLGPSNQFIDDLFEANTLNTNHYTIIARLNWQGFRMIIAGDAQMESWGYFDREKMMSASCSVLRAAHHGSANGTQFERVDRLSPELVVVSSDPHGKDDIPDLIGSAAFLRYAGRSSNPRVALTDNLDAVKTGTIKIEVAPSGRFEVLRYGDRKDQNVNLANAAPLTFANNPTDWHALTVGKIP